MLAHSARDDGGPAERRRRWAVVAVVLWLPPIVQQLRSEDGNLAAIVEFFRAPARGPGGRTAWGIMGTELGPPGAWLAGDEVGVFGVTLARRSPRLSRSSP